MDDNVYTYPEVVHGVGFSEAEKKRWNKNLQKLIERVEGKFRRNPPSKRKRKNTHES